MNDAGMAWIGRQQPPGEVERPVAIDVHILVCNQHDPVEVEGEDTDRELDKGANGGDELGEFLYRRDEQCREQVVEREGDSDTLFVQMGASDDPPGHALVVRPHRVARRPRDTRVGETVECTHVGHRSRAPSSANALSGRPALSESRRSSQTVRAVLEGVLLAPRSELAHADGVVPDLEAAVTTEP